MPPAGGGVPPGAVNVAEGVLALAGLLASYGLAGLGDRSVHALSGGQRQLLALAGVLAVEPDNQVALVQLALARSDQFTEELSGAVERVGAEARAPEHPADRVAGVRLSPARAGA